MADSQAIHKPRYGSQWLPNVNRNTSISNMLKIDGRLSSDTQTVLWIAAAALRIFGSLPYHMLYLASITVLIPTLSMAPKVLYKLQHF
jgi:hypothetical protein